MAFLNTVINPTISSPLRDVTAQGAQVGDYAYDSSGKLYRWSGTGWTAESTPGVSSTTGSRQYDNPPPAFNFNWEQARKTAFDQLTPYYTQKLELAKGDVELAKKYIEEDYKRGVRYSTDTYNTEEKFRQEDLASQLAQEGITQKEETRQAQATANQRGTYVGEMERGQTGAAPTSSYYNEYIGSPMTERQRLRSEAIKRAVQKQSELAGITKTKELGELESTRSQKLNQQDTQFRNYQLEAGQEQREKAYTQYAPLKYQEEYSRYKSSQNIGG